MADYLFRDRVKDTSTTTGTGNFTLAGSPATGFQSFNSAFGTSTNFYYAIVHQSANEWEVGIGTLSAATTLVRSSVLKSTNSNTAVSFTAGTKDVFSTVPADLIASMLPVEAETETGTTYTLNATDKGKEKRFSNASAKTVTVDDTTTLGADFVCIITNTGAGALTITPEPGTTLRNNVTDIPQYGSATVRAIGTDEYLVTPSIVDSALIRTWLGLGTANSPQFTGIELGNASDTTLTRASAGNVNIEGNLIYRAGGTDVPVADGGTGSSTAAGARTALAVDWSRSIAVEDPTNAEDISIFYTTVAITVTELAAVLVGSSTPSVTWTVRHHTDRSNAGNEVVTSGTTTTSTTTGSIVTSFNDATIPADSWVWLETTAKSGTVDELHLTITFSKD